MDTEHVVSAAGSRGHRGRLPSAGAQEVVTTTWDER
jgi:hypothetical protein